MTVFRHDPKDAGSLSHDRVLAVLEDDAQRLWVATADGLNLFARESAAFVRYGRDADNPQSLRDSDVMSLYQDRGGVLWVGTRGGGASHWNPRSWLFGHYRSGAFRDTQVNSFADDGNGKVWVGTVGAGLVEIDTRSRSERHYGASAEGSARLTDDRIMSLLYDRRGVLWIGTMTGGLNRLDMNSGALQVYRTAADDPATLPANGVMSLYEDRLGTLWVGTYGGGLASIDQSSGKVTRYPYGKHSPSSLSGSRASAIVEDAIGNLWIGTEGGGLNLFDRRTGRFYTFRRDDRDPASLSDNSVYALHLDHHGQLWVGTAGGGLDRVIGSSAQPGAVRFENQSGLGGIATQVVYGIESDREDRLWLSTNDGLARLDPNAHSIKWFHQVHGLQDEEFNFNAHYQGTDGTLFFGGNNGFNAFSPDLITPAAPPPRVVLTTAAKLNRVIAPQELPSASRPLDLAYDDKLVTLDFAALDFTSPAHNHYSYQLEGFDSGWIDSGSMHRATYTNLEAGDYVFKVRAANADGVWSGRELAVPVHVAPAPWNTAAARSVYLALGLLLFGYLWRQQRLRRDRELRYSRELEQTVHARTRELEERNRELQVLSRAKSDFVARMSHELRTPMNGVLGMTSLLLDTRIDPAQRRFAEAIHRSADSLLAIVDDILDFSKIEAGRLQLDPVKCDLVELVEQTVEMLAARAATKGIELLCDSPTAPLPRVRMDAVRLRQVLVNLGGNAVKFTERGEVTLRLLLLGSGDGRVGALRGGRHGRRHRAGKPVANFRGVCPGRCLDYAPFRRNRPWPGDFPANRRTDGRKARTGQRARSRIDILVRIDAAAARGCGQRPAQRRSLDGLRVLVVHDNAAARALTAKALRDWQARPTEVPSLAEAVAGVGCGQFDAVVIDDWLLNEADGLWKALRSGQSPNLRTVRLLSFVSLASERDATQDPFDAELTKPLAPRRAASGVERLRR